MEYMLPVLEILKAIAVPILINHGPEIVMAIGAIIYARDWKKLKDLAEEKSLDIADEMLSNAEKREKVASIVWEAVPKKFKVFPFNVIVNENTIRKMINSVYVTQVKPLRDLEGKNVSVNALAHEVESLKEELRKPPQPRDAKGRFIRVEEPNA